MKITKLLFAFNLVKSRSIFPKPRPTTLGYHPDYPNILIPVPLFPVEPFDTKTTVETSTENPKPTTTFVFTTLESTTEEWPAEKEISTTTSTAVQFYTTVFNEPSEQLTATVPFAHENSTSITPVPITSEMPKSTAMASTTQSKQENDNEEGIGLRDGLVAALEMAKELGSMIIGGVGSMFSKITSFFS